jgi:predicted RNase H-like HicB family nuclease
MGKREVVLIAAFLLMGLVVYQFTASDDSASGGFSVSGIIEDLKSEMHRPRHSAEATVTRDVPVEPGVAVIAVPEFRGRLTIIGETRDDVRAELRAAVWTEDRDESSRVVKDVTPSVDTKNDTITVTVEVPGDVPRVRSELTLRVPDRFRVQADVPSGSTDIRGVAAVALDARGEVVISDVRGLVAGAFRDGEVRIADAGSVRITLRRGDANVTDVKGDVAIEASDGNVTLREAGGGVQLTAVRVDATVGGTAGPLRVNASDGRTTVDDPGGSVDVEGVRTSVTIRLARAVPVHAATTDDGITIVPPASGITLIGVASEGRIRSDLAGVPIEKQEALQRVRAELAGGGPTVTLRTTRGDIDLLPSGSPTDVER